MHKASIHSHTGTATQEQDAKQQAHSSLDPMVIVGGGIAGIYAALRIQSLRPTQKIVIVEQAPMLGGLLASKQFDGCWFDFGTHVPRHTGHDDIDAFLFGHLPAHAFRQFQNINAANVSLHKTLYTDSPNPFLATSSNHDVEKQLEQIQANQSALETQSKPENLEQQLTHLFGNSLVETFFRPSLQKRFDTDLSELAVDAHRLVGLSRIIMGSADRMRALKQQPEFDAVLSFAKQTEGMSELTNYYPAGGEGIGKWLDCLLEQLNHETVEIHTNTSVKALDMKGSTVSSLTLESANGDETHLQCQHLFWCGPVFPLLALSKADYQSRYRPQIRKTYLYHFGFDEAPLIDSNYVNINDPELQSFRVTLYSNLSPTDSDIHRVTVEVISDVDIKDLPDVQEIIEELKEVGIMSSTATCQFTHTDTVNAGFPVLTPDFFTESKAQAAAANQHIQNLCLLGKANGSSFFMQDVLVDAHQQIDRLLSADGE